MSGARLLGGFGAAMVVATLLVACGESQQAQPAAEPPPAKDGAFDDLTGTIDKARGVESTLQQEKEAADRAIEESIDAPTDQ